jgi:opacity protein-like surface antigen
MIKNPAKLWIGVSLPLLMLAATTARADMPAETSTAPVASDSQSAQQAPKDLETSSVPSRFGFSLGLGSLSATGNRGLMWQSSNPMYDIAAYYWLTSQIAVDVEGSTVNDSYVTSTDNGGNVNVNVKHLEFGLRYYGDLHSVLARVFSGFVSPFATLGLGVFSMTKTSFIQSTSEPADNQIGMTLGAGLRFELAPKTLFLELMGRWNSVTFSDTYTPQFQASNNVPDQTGQFISWNANVLVKF